MIAVMTVSKFPALQFPLSKDSRHMAYSAVGEANSPYVLLCLPGLLETRATFDPLLQAAEGLQGLRVISVDLCGRGDSSPLPGDKGYTMQVYLEDIVHFIRAELMPDGKPVPHIEVLGTSMGGILAMYLAHDAQNQVSGLFFNDIGLDLPWMSIYGLYDGMKKEGRLPTPEEMAAKFNVSIGAVLAVQSPSHFDLPYRKDWKGMKFGHLLSGFKGPVRLMHGSESGVCPVQQVKELQREFPKAQVLEVAGAAHPVPFNAMVNQFVLQSLNLPAAVAVPAAPPKSQHVREASQAEQLLMPLDTPEASTQAQPVAEVVAEPEPVVSASASVAAAHDEATQPRVGFLGLLKQLLGATKK
jgi:pimeloyl-ACP methyl ester carboxylesterase